MSEISKFANSSRDAHRWGFVFSLCVTFCLIGTAFSQNPDPARTSVPSPSTPSPATEGIIVVFKEAPADDAPPLRSPQTMTQGRRNVLPGVPGIRKVERALRSDIRDAIRQRAHRRDASKGKAAGGGPPRASADGSRAARALRSLENMYRAQIEPGEKIEDVIVRIQEDPNVLFAEPDYPIELFAAPDDTYFAQQWALQNTGQSYRLNSGSNASGHPGADIKWAQSYGTPGFPTDEVLVAVIDTGIDYNHSDIVNQMWVNPGEIPGNGIDDDGNGYIDDIHGIDSLFGDSDPMDDNGHGTHCAGTIAATGNNALGVVGVNPYAKVMAVKFLGNSGGSTSGAIEAILYAVNNGAKILSNSWGGGAYSQALQDTIDYANDQGALFVAAAGNNGAYMPLYPAAYRGVLCVGSTNSIDVKSPFSNYGEWLDVVAPGSDIISLKASAVHPTQKGVFSDDTNYYIISGTSMATPHVAGLASLLYAKHPGKAPYIYERVIRAATDSVDAIPGNAGFVGKLGNGRINVPNTLGYQAAAGFLSALANTPGGDSSNVQQGDVVTTEMRAFTWSSPLPGLSVHLTNVSGGLTVSGASSCALGDLPAYAEVSVPADTFRFTVKDETLAPWGSEQSYTFELRQGSAVLDTRTVTVRVLAVNMNFFVVQDLDGDGLGEILGAYAEKTYCLDSARMVKWVYGHDSSWLHSTRSLATGDFNGNGQKEVASWIASVNLGSAFFTVLNNDGSLWKKAGIGPNFANTIERLLVADINDDGRDDLLFVDKWSGSLRAYDVVAMTENDAAAGRFFNIAPKNTGAIVSDPFVGDVNGDGASEIVVVESLALGAAYTENYARVFSKTGALLWEVPLPSGYRYDRDVGAMGDLDGDGTMELVVQGYSSGGTFLFALDLFAGAALDGWPKEMLTKPVTLADLDLDGDLEVITLSGRMKRVFAWHHDGATVQGFPIYEPGIRAQHSLSAADINADGAPDLVYITNFQADPVNGVDYFDVVARDGKGLLHHGFPVTISQAHEEIHADFTMASVEALAPGIDGENAKVSILAKFDGPSFHVIDTGYDEVPEGMHWKGRFNDFNNKHNTCEHRSIGLQARFVATSARTGYGSATVSFHAKPTGRDQAGLRYHWDFDNDGSFDLADSTNASPSHTFTGEGSYSVRLRVTNTAGESWETTHENDITVYPASGVVADFSASHTTGNAPLTVHFRDASRNGATAWAWDFNGDGIVDSTQQNPSWLYTAAGNYTVSLTASAPGGGSNTLIRNASIQLENLEAPTTLFVAPGGSNSAPFKNWQEAAPTLQAAFAAANPGDTIIVDDGVYLIPENEILLLNVNKSGITIRSRNGPEHTFLDGAFRGRILDVTASNFVLEGFTLRHGYSPNGSAYRLMGGDGNHIRNCVITYNRMYWFDGSFIEAEGSVYINGGLGVSTYNELFIEDTVFAYNQADRAGAGVVNRQSENMSNVVVSRCVFHDNEAGDVIWSNGSAVVNAVVRNSLFHNNRGGQAVIENEGWTNAVDNSTIVDNECLRGAVYAQRIRNSIVYYNTPGNWKNDLYKKEGDNYVWVANNYNEPRYYAHANNLSTGAPTGSTITGALSSAPIFVNRAANDYRLASNSPGVNQGVAYADAEWTVLVDIGSPDAQTAGPNWNNITTVETGTKIANAVTTTGGASGLQIDFDLAGQQMLVDQPLRSDVSWPATAQSDAMLHSASGRIFFRNLNTQRHYSMRFVATSATNYGNTRFSLRNYFWNTNPLTQVGQFTQDLNPSQTTTRLPVYRGISPATDDGNNIRLTLTRTGSDQALISALEVQQTGPLFLEPFDGIAWTDYDGAPRVQGAAIDIGAYEFQGNLAPAAAFAIGAEKRVNREVSFDASTSSDIDGSIANYAWDWDNDGTPDASGAGLAQTTHTFSTPGFREVRLTVTDNLGMTAHRVIGFTVLTDAPDPASNLTITSGPSLPLQLSWTDASSNETGFRIERKARAYPEIDVILDNTAPAPKVIRTAEPFSWDGVNFPVEWREVAGAAATAAQAYGGSYHYTDYHITAPAPSGSKPTMRSYYAPQLPESGTYAVSVWLPTNAAFPMPSNVATNWAGAMRVNVLAADNSHPRIVEPRKIGGGGWSSLGTFSLSPDSQIEISLADSSGHLALDAFRFTKVEGFEDVGSVGAGQTSFTDTSARDGFSYTYRVVAFNKEGSGSASNEASSSIEKVFTGPTVTLGSVSAGSGTAPIIVQATATATDAEDDDSALVYLWDFGDGFSGSIFTGVNLQSASYSYRYPGTYTLRVVARDSHGNMSVAATETVTISGALPNAPTQFTATQTSGDTVAIAWTDNATNETGFQIQRRIASGSFEDMATAGINVQSFADTTILPSESYTYRVRAINQHGGSAWTDLATVNTPDLRPPQSFAATVLSDRSVRLDWHGVATSGSSYVLERRNAAVEILVDNTDTALTTVTGSWTTSNYYSGYYGQNYTHDGNTDKGAKSFRFTPVIEHPGIYQVFTRHINSGSSADNVPVSVSHSAGTANYTVNQRIDHSQWVLLGSHEVGNGAFLEISNTGTSGSVCADAVRFLRGSVGSWEVVHTVNGSTGGFTWTDFAKEASTLYEYRIRAFNGTLYGTYTANALAVIPDVQLAAPSNITATHITDTQIRLNWTDQAIGEDGVRIERRPAFIEPSAILADNTDSTGISTQGTWNPATAISGYEGSNYFCDTVAGKGGTSFTCTPGRTGLHSLALRNLRNANGADRIPVTITHAGGTSSVLIAQSSLQEPNLSWDFRAMADAQGITAATNSGTQSAINWNASPSNVSTLNGSLRVRHNTTAETYAGNATLGYAAGTYTIDVDIPGWNMPGTTTDQWFQLGFNTGNDANVAVGLALQSRTSGFALFGRALGNGTLIGSETAPIKLYPRVLTTGVTLRLVANFSANTYQVFYRDADTNGHFVLGASGATITGTIDPARRAGSLRLRMSGDWSQSGEFFDIARIRVLAGAPADNPSAEWLNLGDYTLDESSSITIGTAATYGEVRADALRCAPIVSAAPWALVANTTAEAATWLDTNLQAETAYDYRLQAFSGGQSGSWAFLGNVITLAENTGGSNDYIAWRDAVSWSGKDSSATADADGDGLVNFAEYAFGLDPLQADASSASGVSTATVGGTTHLTLTFTRNRAASEVRFIVQSSVDLSDWAAAFDFPAGVDITEQSNIEVLDQNDEMQLVRVRIPIEGMRGFIRLKLDAE